MKGGASQVLPDATRHILTQPDTACHGKLPNSTCHCNVSWWRTHFCTYFVSRIRHMPHGATHSTLHLYKASILSQGFYGGHLAASSRMHSASVSHASSLTWRHCHQSDYRWRLSMVCSTQNNCWGLMNYTIEISRAGIYNICDNNKYNSRPELTQSGPGTKFPELEFEMCTNLYTGIYILFVWFNGALASDVCLFYCTGHTRNMKGNGTNTFQTLVRLENK